MSLFYSIHWESYGTSNRKSPMGNMALLSLQTHLSYTSYYAFDTLMSRIITPNWLRPNAPHWCRQNAASNFKAWHPTANSPTNFCDMISRTNNCWTRQSALSNYDTVSMFLLWDVSKIHWKLFALKRVKSEKKWKDVNCVMTSEWWELNDSVFLFCCSQGHHKK